MPLFAATIGGEKPDASGREAGRNAFARDSSLAAATISGRCGRREFADVPLGDGARGVRGRLWEGTHY
jgi:hypothetical protein